MHDKGTRHRLKPPRYKPSEILFQVDTNVSFDVKIWHKPGSKREPSGYKCICAAKAWRRAGPRYRLQIQVNALQPRKRARAAEAAVGIMRPLWRLFYFSFPFSAQRVLTVFHSRYPRVTSVLFPAPTFFLPWFLARSFARSSHLLFILFLRFYFSPLACKIQQVISGVLIDLSLVRRVSSSMRGKFHSKRQSSSSLDGPRISRWKLQEMFFCTGF